jgi:hypothetical protein
MVRSTSLLRFLPKPFHMCPDTDRQENGAEKEDRKYWRCGTAISFFFSFFGCTRV